MAGAKSDYVRMSTMGGKDLLVILKNKLIIGIKKQELCLVKVH